MVTVVGGGKVLRSAPAALGPLSYLAFGSLLIFAIFFKYRGSRTGRRITGCAGIYAVSRRRKTVLDKLNTGNRREHGRRNCPGSIRSHAGNLHAWILPRRTLAHGPVRKIVKIAPKMRNTPELRLLRRGKRKWSWRCTHGLTTQRKL